QIVAGRNVVHAVEERPIAGEHETTGIQTFGAPARRYAHREQRLRLGGQVKRIVVLGVEQRLHAEAIAAGDQPPIALIPDDESVLAAEMMQAFWAVVL